MRGVRVRRRGRGREGRGPCGRRTARGGGAGGARTPRARRRRRRRRGDGASEVFVNSSRAPMPNPRGFRATCRAGAARVPDTVLGLVRAELP